MQKITSITELRERVLFLEIDKSLQEQVLKGQFAIILEKIKPLNLIKNSFKSAISSPNIIGNILSAALGLGSGFLTKKIVVGTSSNIFRMLLGSVLQVGVTNSVSSHPEALKSITNYLIQHVFHKKTNESASQMYE